jgi:hypothetical protein
MNNASGNAASRSLWTLNNTVVGTHRPHHFAIAKGVPLEPTCRTRTSCQWTAATSLLDAPQKYGGSGVNAINTHLHGGLVPWISDGGQYSWFTPAASGGK